MAPAAIAFRTKDVNTRDWYPPNYLNFRRLRLPIRPLSSLGLKGSRTTDMLAGMRMMPTDVLRKLQNDFAPFCRKYRVRSLAVFGSMARGAERYDSDLDLLVDPSQETTIPEILEMAGEAEEIAGRPVDFVLRASLLKAPDSKRADHILSTAVFLYGY